MFSENIKHHHATKSKLNEQKRNFEKLPAITEIFRESVLLAHRNPVSGNLTPKPEID